MTLRFSLLVAFATLSLGYFSPANAENLFRTGRPDYANNTWQSAPSRNSLPWWRRSIAANQSNPSSFVDRPWTSPHEMRDVYGTSGFAAALPITPSIAVREPRENDYQRVATAWENYRREAMRYQLRHGDDGVFASGVEPRTERALRPEIRPVDQSRTVIRPRCQHGSRPLDSVPRFQRDRLYEPGPLDLEPADIRPTLRPTSRPARSRFPESRFEPFSSSPSRQIESKQNYLDPARTAWLGN